MRPPGATYSCAARSAQGTSATRDCLGPSDVHDLSIATSTVSVLKQAVRMHEYYLKIKIVNRKKISLIFISF